jgi:hypothetical protein
MPTSSLRPVVCLLLGAIAVAAEIPAFLADEARKEGGPLVLTMDTRGTAMGEAFRRLQGDEALVDLDLRLLRLSPETRPKEAFVWAGSRLGSTGWILFSSTGETLASGRTPPAPGALAETLRRAGVRSPIQTLRAFLEEHPGHLEAQAVLLEHLYRAAHARTRRLVSIAPRAPLRQGESFPEAPIPEEVRPLLDDAQDARIWGAFVQAFDAFLDDPFWASRPPDLGTPDQHGGWLHSRLVRVRARRWVPRIQAAILNDPRNGASGRLWAQWADLQPISGLPLDPSFLEPLLPSALQIQGEPFLKDALPGAAQAVVVRAARRSGDWKLATRVLVELVPRRMEEAAQDEAPQGAWDVWVRTLTEEDDWEGSYAPFLEALVHAGDLERASQVARHVAALRYLPDPRRRLRELAKALGRPQLAEAWTR